MGEGGWGPAQACQAFVGTIMARAARQHLFAFRCQASESVKNNRLLSASISPIQSRKHRNTAHEVPKAAAYCQYATMQRVLWLEECKRCIPLGDVGDKEL